MGLLESIKPFWPLLFTFVLPRAINYYRVVKTAIRTRPPPRPLPEKTGRGLNALFASICLFLYASLPFRGALEDHNIFVVTQSHLMMSTDVLFGRLALMRENGMLTPVDEALRSKFTSSTVRQMYLAFGPSTLLKCTFCHPDDTTSYLLYHLPTNVLGPHLLHILLVGIATSEAFSGIEAHHWRQRALVGSLILLGIDAYLTSSYYPAVNPSMPAPAGTFWLAASLRYVTLCAFDAAVAFLIYASATRRFLLFSAPSSADPELARRRRDEMLTQANVSLQMASTNLRAYSVARNAVLRNNALKATDDDYWRAVVAFEGSEGDESLFEDEEVQAALAAAYGTGKIDVPTMRRETEAFVANVTKGL